MPKIKKQPILRIVKSQDDMRKNDDILFETVEEIRRDFE